MESKAVPARYDPNRNLNGHFIKGNLAHAFGGEEAKRYRELRAAWLSCQTDDDIREVYTALKDLAINCKNPDVKFRAQVYYLDRTFGRPKESLSIDVQTQAVEPVVELSPDEIVVLEKIIERS